MSITIDYKNADFSLQKAIAKAVGRKEEDVEVLVSLPNSLIPYCAEWRIVSSCADVCAKVCGEYLLLDVI